MASPSQKTYFLLLGVLFFLNSVGFLWKQRSNDLQRKVTPSFFEEKKQISYLKRSSSPEPEWSPTRGNNSYSYEFSDDFEGPTKKPHCNDIHEHQDKCEFVKSNCQDVMSGLIDYLHFYFCVMQNWEFVALFMMFTWLLFMFGFIGVAASDFFCPNLNTIASKLKLSESMAGVTFLAFGNGSPDLFSTFTAISHNSGSLAIGELIGAASFITSVVAGSMAVVAPFRVTKVPFLRDVIFFTVAISLALAIIWDGKIYLWESIILVLFYIVYVSVVVIGNWWAKNLKRRKWQEQKARDEYNPNPMVEVNTDNPEITIEDEYGSQDAYGYESYDETDLLLPDAEHGGRAIPISMSNMMARSQHEAQAHSFLSASEAVDQAMHFHRPPRPALRGTRPSLFGAIEFRDVVNSLRSDGNYRGLGTFGRSYTSDFYTRSRTLPYNRINNNELRRRSWASYSGTVETHNPIVDDETLNSHVRFSSDSHLSPTNYSQESNLDQTQADTSRVPNLTIVPPLLSTSSSLSPVQLFNSPLSLSPREEIFHVTNDPTSLSPKGSPLLSPVLQQSTPQISLLDNVLSTLFPSLIGFSNKSLFAKITALMACPAFLLLTLTLPVVIAEDSSTDDNQINPIDNQLIQPPTIVINDDPDLLIVPEPEKDKPIGWNRWLTAVQFLLAPLFVSIVLFSDDQPMAKLLIYSSIVGLLLSALCIFFTCDEQPPIFYSLLCFVGFGVAMVWIYLVANEVVSLMEALGLIIGVSDAILGLTIFAMGNSLGDFVANITVAKMGLPMMAMSACFGGPMLNILLGIGLSGTYVTAKTGVPYKIKVEPTLFVSSLGLFIVLFSALIYLPRNDYLMTRTWGYYLILVYTVCMVTNVILETRSIKGIDG